MAYFPEEEFPVSNLLLITDVARLRKVFGRLTEDKNIRLRIVNNLEKGGEEITIEKPDVVFVQTHLSGLSADILLMHLKKQLGRKRTRFVLLASPSQTSDAILKPYQGWLDTSAEDGPLLAELHRLLATLLNKPKKGGEPAEPESAASVTAGAPPALTGEASAPPDIPPASESSTPQHTDNDLEFPVITAASSEPSLEEQGITYAPRQRLTVYSEFNSSFDSAVNSTPEPEPLEQATPVLAHDWNAETIDTIETTQVRSKKGAFLLWLVPVIIVVVIITLIQQQKSSLKPEPAKTVSAAGGTAKPAVAAPAAPAASPAKVPVPTAAVVPQEQDRMSDKAVLSAIAENRNQKEASPPSATRPTALPAFIPRNGLDKQFSAANPGWERYKGQVTEFKVLRQGPAIKAIQIIDRGGNGVPESFLKGVLSQVAKKPSLSIDSAEKKEGYEIQRGRVAENIRIVYYRDESSGKLQAFVLTWQ